VGRLATLRDGSNNVIVSYAYDAAGRLSQKTNGNGTYTTYQYDGNGHILHLINYAPGGSINSRFDDTYNALGLKTAEATLDGTWTYTYDAIGQLVHAVFASNNPATIPNQDLVYNYDSVGNRTSTVLNGVTTNYVTNNMNQYASVGGVAFSYDAKGNLLSDAERSYRYDIVNRLVGMSYNSVSDSYAYDALNQRISKTEGTQTSRYLIDPIGLGDVVGIFANGNANSNFVYGIDLAQQVVGNTPQFFDFDIAGSTIGRTVQSGLYENQYAYLPFGGTINPDDSDQNPFKFIGSLGVITEDESFYFMRARFMVGSIDRFSSQDPKGLLGGSVGLYSYALNNPLTFVDPSGLAVNWHTIAVGYSQITSGASGAAKGIALGAVVGGPVGGGIRGGYGIVNGVYGAAIGTTNLLIGVIGEDALPVPSDLYNLAGFAATGGKMTTDDLVRAK